MDPSTIRAESPDELIETEEIFAKPTGVSRPPPPEPIVVQEKPPQKQKRPLSEKQKAHLQRITKLAAEKRRAKKAAETPELPKQSLPEPMIKPPETPAPKTPTPAPLKHQAPTKDDFQQWMENFARFDALVQQREAQAEQQRAAKEAAEKEQQNAKEKTEPVGQEFGEYTKYFL